MVVAEAGLLARSRVRYRGELDDLAEDLHDVSALQSQVAVRLPGEGDRLGDGFLLSFASVRPNQGRLLSAAEEEGPAGGARAARAESRSRR